LGIGVASPVWQRASGDARAASSPLVEQVAAKGKPVLSQQRKRAKRLGNHDVREAGKFGCILLKCADYAVFTVLF
jgi:hypothetical protein